jgi:hypothetical protein
MRLLKVRRSVNNPKEMSPTAPHQQIATPLKYPKPHILLIDLPSTVERTLRDKGFNVTPGTLGRPYRVKKTSAYLPLIGTGDVPRPTEQEIIVIDLNFGELADAPTGAKHRPDGELDLWAKCDEGFLDPRVRPAMSLRKPFDRILDSGGAFVVFADAKTDIDMIVARNEYDKVRDVTEDVWHILADLSDMTVVADEGREMLAASGNSPLVRLLAPFLDDGNFTCTLQHGYRYEDPWVPLALNKFGDVIAFARARSTNGTVIVVPQIRDKAGFLTELLTTTLPEIAPHLFPDIEQARWTHRPEYELPPVVELKAQQQEIVRRAKEEIQRIEAKLAEARMENGWMHNLITGTDTQLVDAVEDALAALGFSSILDIDAERDREGKSRREDLQIDDQRPTVVVDIKGIGGYPSDEDGLQAGKHASIRMREQGRTDIVGLSIINHQRYLPPLDRENAMPFRQELIDSAQEMGMGLLTAWDLYKLVRNFARLGWRHENVKPLFYQNGRIFPVPGHYQFIGTVAKAWTDKLGVVISQGELQVGDRIAVEFPIDFEEAPVDSIHVKDLSVERAKMGEPAGLRWPTGKPKVREGLRVFRVRTTDPQLS